MTDLTRFVSLTVFKNKNSDGKSIFHPKIVQF